MMKDDTKLLKRMAEENERKKQNLNPKATNSETMHSI